MFSLRLVQNMIKIKRLSFRYFNETHTVCLKTLLCYSCILLCYLLYVQLKLRSYFRLLVLCFVWASLHFVGMVWHLCPLR